MKLSVIVPVYNEEATVGEILKQVRNVEIDMEKEIIVVDDFSTDGTREVLKKEAAFPGTHVLFQDKNMGKGAAIRRALGHVSGDFVIIQDGDLEYDPADYSRLLNPVLRGKAEVVYGSRFTGERRNMLFWHYLGNRFLSLTTNVLFNTTISDMETCYKLFRRDVLNGIVIKSNRFNFEPEVTAKVLRQGIRIYEVPISYTGREFEEGKKISWKDGFSALWTIVKYRFVR